MRHTAAGRLLAAMTLVAMCAAPAPAQPGPDAEPLTPIWLPRADYPPIARAARIQGDVEVDVEVDTDGSVASATMRSGHAVLGAAALAAARETHFISRRGDRSELHYSLVYTFALGDSLSPPDTPAAVTRTGARMTTVAPAELMSCGPSPLAVPGPQCLYLWRCGRDWDWYYRNESARAAKCLWLWGCGDAKTD